MGEYFDEADLTRPVLSRIDATIDFNWTWGSPHPSIGNDSFSVRWTGEIAPLFSEVYTFRTTSDDGVRLWVADQLIIDRWVDQVPTTRTGSIALVAGRRYHIRLEYYERYGDASIQLQWSSRSQPQQVVPMSRLFAASGPLTELHGLQAEYYDNVDLTNLKVTRTEPYVDFDWGESSPNPAIAPDTFSVRLTGQVLPRFTETYTFHATVDDGVRLWIDDRLLIDRWIDQPATTHRATINLTAGQRYRLRLECYEKYGGALMKLSWSSPSQVLEIVPNSQLFVGEALSIATPILVTGNGSVPDSTRLAPVQLNAMLAARSGAGRPPV